MCPVHSRRILDCSNIRPLLNLCSCCTKLHGSPSPTCHQARELPDWEHLPGWFVSRTHTHTHTQRSVWCRSRRGSMGASEQP